METNNSAVFSLDRKYRYALWRIWDEKKPLIMFIGLNPSTANEDSDDPTIRRVKKFASDWGYGGVYMTNLFAFVTAYPEELKKCKDPLGSNDEWLEKISKKCKKIIFAWGNFKEAEQRGKQVSEKFPNALCLARNKNGSPKHPLYIKADTISIPFMQ